MAPIWSVLANRKDKANQRFWTQSIIPAVDGCCPAEPGAIVLLGPDCKIDPCLLPSESGGYVYVNGNPVPIEDPSPNFNNTTPNAPVGYTNVIWQYDASGNISAYYATSGTVVSFGQVTSGTNTSANMVVGSGASVTVACPGTGVIEATELATNTCTPVVTNLSAPTHPGQLLISQPGNDSAIWADPQVQGLYAAGSTICPAPAYVAPTCIQPILIGGADCNGVLQNVAVTTGGEVIVLAQDQETDINVQRFACTTGSALRTNATAALVPLMSITPKVGESAVRFTFRNLDFLSGGQLTHFQLLLNATLTGASFQNVDPASEMTYDVAATAYTGGRLLDAGYIGADSRHNDYEFVFSFNGATPPMVTLVYSPVTGSKSSVAGCSFAWDEQSTCL
jgi:hypothetical protein